MSATPEDVVAAFICEMNAWEKTAWELFHPPGQVPDSEACWQRVRAEVERVFGTFCTPKNRPYGRQASFQHPPEYDPERERIVQGERAGRKAYVDTERSAAVGGGLRRYTLQLGSRGWLIDNVKRKSGEKWTKAIL